MVNKFIVPSNVSDDEIKQSLLKIGVKSFMNEAGFIPEKLIDGIDFVWKYWGTRIEEQIADFGDWMIVYGEFDPLYDGNKVARVNLLIFYADFPLCGSCHKNLQDYFYGISPTLRFTSRAWTNSGTCVGCEDIVYGVPF